MIKIKTDEGHMELTVKGSLKTIAADTCMILYNIFKSVAEEDLMAAAAYATLIKRAVDSGAAWFGAPLTEDDDDTEEEKEEEGA